MKRGSTLVEVLVSCLILAILAITAGSFASASAGTTRTNRNRCVALARASSRLEEVCATPYGVLTNRSFMGSTAWIKWNGAGWAAGDDERFKIGPAQCPLLTRLSLGGDRLTVTVWAGDRAGQSLDDIAVRLETIVAPID